MILPVSLTIAAACGALNLWLALRTSAGRIRGKVMIGDGGDPVMLARTRAHANFTEYAPFVLILIALIELAGGSPDALWLLGATFVLARIAHGVGMLRPAPNVLRAGGALLTWLLLAGLAGWALAITGWAFLAMQ
ncbi:MAPEG family protein [Sphingomonas sp. Leaf343]|uniref:MAPEG family protein n=1 Tax=Sphingomonas sp. Leaf343 TaxID=1736345 RepID=UPI0006F69ECB|nr:MAPEG family protein [Sphingomonas sp. Leaf343]KQR87805.1 GST-like protein [Sphingomonas sp. Leaf343]